MAASRNPSLRISPGSRAILKELASHERKSMQTILDEAIQRYQREKFFDDVNSSYARLKSDPEAWNEELAERQLWDHTLADGLDTERTGFSPAGARSGPCTSILLSDVSSPVLAPPSSSQSTISIMEQPI